MLHLRVLNKTKQIVMIVSNMDKVSVKWINKYMEKLIERPHTASATLTGVFTYVAWWDLSSQDRVCM